MIMPRKSLNRYINKISFVVIDKDYRLILAANMLFKELMLDFDWFWSPRQKQ